MDLLILSAATFYVWYVIARVPPPFLRPLRRVLLSRPTIRELALCPWCLSPYVAFLLSLLLVPLSLATIPLVLAAAAVTGVAGTLIPDDGDSDDD